MFIWGRNDYVARLEAYFSELYPNEKRDIISFPLEYEKSNSKFLNLASYQKQLENISLDSEVYAAFTQEYRQIAEDELRKCGFSNVIFYDSALDNALKKEYFRKIFAREGKDFNILLDMEDEHEPRPKKVTVYMAKSIVDKPLSKEAPLSQYVVPIQVGAALTNQRIADITDNTGDNISARNKRYSEMTAFYWMWKNADADYLGICHYRRVWSNLDEVVAKLQVVDVDAILPLPTLSAKPIQADFLPRHIPQVWNAMMKALKEMHPDYYVYAQKIFNARILYANNMCILSRKTLDDLCEWMFPIVEYIEMSIGDIENAYYNRYAGFVTEWLMTLYYLVNKNNNKIIHSEKHFIK